MSVHPVPSAFETRCNLAFDALMWAMSRPGRITTLPEAGPGSVIDALVDRECTVHATDPALHLPLMRSGAEVTDLAAADFVFLDAAASAGELEQVRCGSDLYPDDGATVILPAELGAGAGLRLSGPGVDGHLDVQIAGLPEGLWSARAARLRFPIGFDLILIDGARVMGLPRSTTVKVL